MLRYGSFVFSVLAIFLCVSVAWAQPEPPVPVSPGGTEALTHIAQSCPTFSWGAVEGAHRFDLVVYELQEGAAEAEHAIPVIQTALPGTATSWTPSLEERLEPGRRYAWFVRARDEYTEGEWSEGHYFKVEAAPLEEEVAEALEVLRRYLAQHPGEAPEVALAETVLLRPEEDTGDVVVGDVSESKRRADVPDALPLALASGVPAIRGEIPDTSGVTYGVIGVSNSTDGVGVAAQNTSGGADLLLDGAIPTALTEAGIQRNSPSALTFDVANAGAGSMQLRVDGSKVFTAATDGSGSGMDADLLDGIEASDFVQSASDHGRVGVASSLYEDSTSLTDKYVNQSGDSMTGRLAVSAISISGWTESIKGTLSSAEYGAGVFGLGEGNHTHGVYGGATSIDGAGVHGESINGNGVVGKTNASSAHAGYFTTATGERLGGATVYAHNSHAHGIALYARNESSDDVTAAFINMGTGYLMKGFGGDGGNHEFAVFNDGKIWTKGGLQVVGSARVTTPVLEITGGADLSEQFEVGGTTEESVPSAGTVLSIDSENPGHLKISDTPYDRKVAGVISGAGGVNPGMLMRQTGSKADGATPVALSGRVYCWVDTQYGSIEPGDLLTTSPTPGHAMKVTDHTRAQGAILGKALSSLRDGRGLTLILVSLQ